MKRFIVPILLVSLIVIISCATTFKLPKWWDDRGETVATIIWNNPGLFPEIYEYAYKVNGQTYTDGGERYGINGLAIGDKFMVAYSKSKPSRNYLLDCKIVFEEDELTATVPGEILNFTKMNTKSYVRPLEKNQAIMYFHFAYSVNRVRYQRTNCFYSDDVNYPVGVEWLVENAQNDSLLNKGLVFKIKYWLNNPQRSTIILNEPLIFRRLE